MLRRPQRTEAAQRLEARTARTFAAPLRAGVSKTVAPRAAKLKPLRLEREHRAYSRRCFCSRSTARALHSGTVRAAQQCTRRARAADAAGQPLHALAECGRAAQAASV